MNIETAPDAKKTDNDLAEKATQTAMFALVAVMIPPLSLFLSTLALFQSRKAKAAGENVKEARSWIKWSYIVGIVGIPIAAFFWYARLYYGIS